MLPEALFTTWLNVEDPNINLILRQPGFSASDAKGIITPETCQQNVHFLNLRSVFLPAGGSVIATLRAFRMPGQEQSQRKISIQKMYLRIDDNQDSTSIWSMGFNTNWQDFRQSERFPLARLDSPGESYGLVHNGIHYCTITRTSAILEQLNAIQV